MSKKPVLLCIMDGFGKNDSDYGNAIVAAKTPNLDKIMAENPMTYIGASGMDVGLPDGQMGNSEVGHTNIGAGRVVYQELTRITKSIKDGDFFENEALKGAMENCLKNDSALHLMGLMSDGGVHSHNTHMYGILELAKKHNIVVLEDAAHAFGAMYKGRKIGTIGHFTGFSLHEVKNCTSFCSSNSASGFKQSFFSLQPKTSSSPSSTT